MRCCQCHYTPRWWLVCRGQVFLFRFEKKNSFTNLSLTPLGFHLHVSSTFYSASAAGTKLYRSRWAARDMVHGRGLPPQSRRSPQLVCCLPKAGGRLEFHRKSHKRNWFPHSLTIFISFTLAVLVASCCFLRHLPPLRRSVFSPPTTASDARPMSKHNIRYNRTLFLREISHHSNKGITEDHGACAHCRQPIGTKETRYSLPLNCVHCDRFSFISFHVIRLIFRFQVFIRFSFHSFFMREYFSSQWIWFTARNFEIWKIHWIQFTWLSRHLCFVSSS